MTPNKNITIRTVSGQTFQANVGREVVEAFWREYDRGVAGLMDLPHGFGARCVSLNRQAIESVIVVSDPFHE